MGATGGRTARNNGPSGRVSLANQLYHSIRNQIITWQISSDEILVEARLAKEYNVSKTPVREALALLSQDGLVEVLPRVGYRVTPISIQDVHEIFNLRILLEGEVAVCVAPRPVEAKLHALLEEDRAKARILSLEGGSLREYLNFHDTFHLGIAELSGNVRLARYVGQLLWDGARLRMLNPFITNRNGIQEEQEDTEQIVRALFEQNAGKARKLLQEHIHKAKERILTRIASMDSDNLILCNSSLSLELGDSSE